MSGVVVVLPVVASAAWPVLVTAASCVMTAMGYSIANTVAEAAAETGSVTRNMVTLDVSNTEEVSLGREESLTFVKDGVTVVFRRNARGRLTVCVEGNLPKAELRELGEQLAGKVLQQFAYNRIVESMSARTGMSLVEQSVDEDETIRIKLRSWEE